MVSACFGTYSASCRPLYVYPCGGQVHPLGVFVEHPEGREPPDRAGDRALHLHAPTGRNAVLVAVVVERHDFLFEQPVEVQRIGVVLRPLVRVGLATADGPAVVADPALVPPAVENGQVRDAVARRLHATRPGCLKGTARVVEPDVDALDHEPGYAHVVVLKDEDATAQLWRARAGEDLLDHALAGAVGRMGLPGEDDLDRTVRVPQQPRDAVHIREDQAGALVRREPSGETDG